jgi:RNase H-fold protein (predicted Holliday junction resolvase)
MSAVLGIDPGTRKCGFAVIERAHGEALALGIVPLEALPAQLTLLARSFAIRAVALGGGTHTTTVAALVRAAGLPVTVVDERETTLRARARYFEAHPPQGWKRFVPRGMLLPPCPIDDFAALLIAERFLEREAAVPGG